MELAAGYDIGSLEDPPEKAPTLIRSVLADGQREHYGKKKEGRVPGVAPELPERTVAVDRVREPSVQGFIVHPQGLPSEPGGSRPPRGERRNQMSREDGFSCNCRWLGDISINGEPCAVREGYEE